MATTVRYIWSTIRRVWITLGLGVTAVFIVWSLVAYRSSREARDATASNSAVTVVNKDGVWFFDPSPPHGSTPTLVFLPGALVDPRAYAPLARAIAETGYRVRLVELPRRGAFGGSESLDLEARIKSLVPLDGSGIVIGGHSRGAVVASRFTQRNPRDVAGLVIIGSSHPRDHDLSWLTIPVTKIVGTRDGLASPTEVRQNAALLPVQTRWIWVEGGNHSQFGWYGFQPMDRRPRVDAATQRQVMIEGVRDILEGLALTQPPPERTRRP